MSNSIEHTNSGVTEITGTPGQAWGSFVVPAGGKSSLRIVGDTLQGKTVVNFGLETKEIYTRIQAIDSIEVIEGRMWWLLFLGLATLFLYFIGVIFIVLFFVFKQNCLVVHSNSASLVIFHQDTNRAKQFSQNLLLLARQLNASTASRSSTATNSRQPQNNQRPTRPAS